MDRVANWVRFADTKATILTAGLGVVLSMFMTNASTVVNVAEAGCGQASTIYVIGSMAALSFGYTLFWLVRAIGPQSSRNLSLNRFAWPSLLNVSAIQLRIHAESTPANDDAWS